MQFLSVSEARAQAPRALGEPGDGIVLTKNGIPVAVVLSIGEYRALAAMARIGADPLLISAEREENARIHKSDLGGYVELEGV